MSVGIRDRFLDRVSVQGKHWIWTGTRDGNYGVLKRAKSDPEFDGRNNHSAHRLAWYLFRGNIPKGKSVLHRCDIGLCVNPDCLFLGTNGDNNKDRHYKNRDARGERHGMHKLTEDDVLFIRSSDMRQIDLMRKFGVCKRTIRSVKMRQTWTHI